MIRKKSLFNFQWDVDKYKKNYDPEHWELCKSFMITHQNKYPEQKLVHLTEAFYQIGVYGSSYDPKTTRLVSALTIEVLDKFLDLHPGAMRHPFRKSAVVTQEVSGVTSDDPSSKEDAEKAKSTSTWDVAADKSIIANILVESQMKSLLKGLVIIYDVTRESTMNDNKVSIIEESFKRSKFGPLHWDKDETHNNLCPIRMSLKWKGTVLAEGEGSEDKTLRLRLAQAVLSKISTFTHGIEAKWSYYRDGRKPDLFDRMNPRKSNVYKSMPRSQFKGMEEITSFIDTFANSDSFAEIIFGMDFSNHEKTQMMEYITKSWGTRLKYRTVTKAGVKSKGETHLCLYHIRTGEELKRWLENCGGENERYRLVQPKDHRRAGVCDHNVREVLTTETDEATDENTGDDLVEDKNQNTMPEKPESFQEKNKEELDQKKKGGDGNTKDNSTKNEKLEVVEFDESGVKKQVHGSKSDEEVTGSSLEKLLDGFVLFYNAKRNSEIDKDDWFSALCDSFKMSKFGSLEVIMDNIRPLRTRCVLKWNNKTLATAEGLTETQAKTAATLQLISKLEPFTYIIQAKEEYFVDGKVPPFIENPDPNKSGSYRVVRRKDLLSYYSIFQTIDEFTKKQSDGELIFGADFTWELKNEIVVYLKAKGLDYRYFTTNDQKPWSHMAIYHTINPENLKDQLLKSGGENDKYKLIPPQRVEPVPVKIVEVEVPKVPENPTKKPSAVVKRVEKRKQPTSNTTEPTLPEAEEAEGSKIQINLKKFKKDKVEYPEDTGGDFPGLILWIGIRKNSTWQKNLFCILIESFKLSKYGELTVEESDENVWGRKEPFKKCVIKSNRKVLAVGLGESKGEAKNSASMQVLRQLRKHCYTIQAKQSYFKEGKATPYNFNPDPTKEHIYSVVKRNKFKDRAAIIKYIDEFSKKICDEEIIFGDDFTFDEREAILNHCRQIKLTYRLMKCQSVGKGLHTHVAVFHQKPPPVIKAALMEVGGENDMYRLIPPGGKVTHQVNEIDLWPDTLEGGKIEEPTPGNLNSAVLCIKEEVSLNSQSNLKSPLITPSIKGSANIKGGYSEFPTMVSTNIVKGDIVPTLHLTDTSVPTGRKIPVKLSGPSLKSSSKSESAEPTQNVKSENSRRFPPGKQQQPNHNSPQSLLGPHTQPMDYNVGAQSLQPFHFDTLMGPQPLPLNYDIPMGPHPQPIDYKGSMGPHPHDFNAPMGIFPQPVNFVPLYPKEIQGNAIQEIPYDPQHFYIPPPIPMHGGLQEMPLQFGPQPSPLVEQQMQPTNLSTQGTVDFHQLPNVSEQEPTCQLATSKEGDLRDELAKKRQAENQHKETPDRRVYDVSMERTNIRKEDEESDGWSRKVFVTDSQNTEEISQEKTEDLRDRLTHKDSAKDNAQRKISEEKIIRKILPARNRQGELLKRNSRWEPPTRGRQTGPQKSMSGRRDVRTFSPDRDCRRVSPKQRNLSTERDRSLDRMRQERLFRSRESLPLEERHSREYNREHNYRRDQLERRRSDSRSPRRWSPIISPRRSPSLSYRDEVKLRRRISPTPRYRELWDNIEPRLAENIFMYKYVRQDSRTETEPIALLRATRALDFNVDFDYIIEQMAIDEWKVSVILMTDYNTSQPLVGEGWGVTEREAKLRASYQAVDSIQKVCHVIEPNYSYFAEGGVPEFIARRSPMKTRVYEIIQNMDPGTPLSRYTIEVMLGVFLRSELEDLFFLATDFSYFERVLVIEIANQMGLWWRLFGPRRLDAAADDVVSTQDLCVYKQCSAISLAHLLHDSGGSTLKYTLVNPQGAQL
uniref:XRN2-binding (XTBD) domain-containing protein n=1 Tax=Graphocephala atropunctata TaxID=36148 RepID=A0A1B6KUT3_9HEMI